MDSIVSFFTIVNIVTETAIVSSRTLPVGLQLPTFSKNSLYRLCSSGSHRPVYEAHPGATTFPSVWSYHDQLHGAIRFPQHLFSNHDQGRQRSERGVAWLYIEPSPCGVVRPAGDPVDSDPGAVFEDDLHPGSDAGRPLEPWVCRHTREPTEGELPPISPECWPFSPALPVTLARTLLPPKQGWLGQGQVMTVVPGTPSPWPRWYSAHAVQQNVVALEFGSPCPPRSPHDQ